MVSRNWDVITNRWWWLAFEESDREWIEKGCRNRTDFSSEVLIARKHTLHRLVWSLASGGAVTCTICLNVRKCLSTYNWDSYEKNNQKLSSTRQIGLRRNELKIRMDEHCCFLLFHYSSSVQITNRNNIPCWFKCAIPIWRQIHNIFSLISCKNLKSLTQSQ